jgi:hypothetical protein
MGAALKTFERVNEALNSFSDFSYSSFSFYSLFKMK